MKERGMYLDLWRDLSRHKAMVFLAGPRQAGKTTLAHMIARSFANRAYFNWDLFENKRLLMDKPSFFQDIQRKDGSTPLVVFDEIHKYRRWKNYLKGVYDQFANEYKFLVLGSGRLNLFQKGGDSLAGRYFLCTLWPFTLAELAEGRRSFQEFIRHPLAVPDGVRSSETIWRQLAQCSGFPEPYLAGRETFYRRWSNNYRQQLIREDIRNLTDIKNIDDVEMLYALLPTKVGSPLSMDSLARDVQVSFNSVRNWLTVFESFFLTFRLAPWMQKISRAIVKEKKLYFYDYARIASPPERFENMVAVELLRAVSNWNDFGFGDFTLHYIRNKEGEEVDFLIARDHVPMLLVESKFSDDTLSKSLAKFQARLNIPAVQLVNRPGVYKIQKPQRQNLLIVTASRWLTGLP